MADHPTLDIITAIIGPHVRGNARAIAQSVVDELRTSGRQPPNRVSVDDVQRADYIRLVQLIAAHTQQEDTP